LNGDLIANTSSGIDRLLTLLTLVAEEIGGEKI
jgi:hypothetical protein